MNKDLEVLKNVPAYMQMVRSLDNRVAFERDQCTKVTTHLSFSGGGGGGKPKTFDDLFERISELETRHDEKLRMYEREIKRAESIINDIPIEKMQTFVLMVYVENMTKQEVMEGLRMTEWEYRMAKDAIEKADSMAEVEWNKRAEGK